MNAYSIRHFKNKLLKCNFCVKIIAFTFKNDSKFMIIIILGTDSTRSFILRLNGELYTGHLQLQNAIFDEQKS